MAPSSINPLRQRADQLHAEGMTRLRIYRQLRKEFPNTERDVLVNESRLPGYRRGVNPFWTEINGTLLRPVICKKPPKGA